MGIHAACLIGLILSLGVQAETTDEDLLALSLEELMDLTIRSSASLSETTLQTRPSAMTTITREQIHDSSARSLIELLDMYVPNFQWTLHWVDKRHLGLRGIISNLDDKYLLLVNGRIMNERTDFGVFSERDLPMMSDIHHIDVVRGPAAASYGPGALAMVINIITENAATFKGQELSLRAGAEERFTELEYKYGKSFTDSHGLFFYVGSSEYQGSPIADSPINLGRDNQDYSGTIYHHRDEIKDYFQNFNGSYKDRPRFKTHAQYNLEGLDLWFRYTEGGELMDNLWPNYETGQGYDQATINASYEHELTSTFDMKYILSYDILDIESTPSPGPRGVHWWNYREEELYARVQGDWKPYEGHAFVVGGEWSYEMFGRDHSGLQPSTWLMNNMPFWETQMFSLLGEYQWNINDYFTFFASGRLDNHTIAGEMISPKGVFIYTPTDQDALKFMVSKSVRTNSAVAMKDRDLNGLGADTEELKAYEIRYERQQTTQFSIGSSVFFYEHDQIGWANGDYSGYQPLGRTDSWGFELEASYHTEKSRFDISHSYTKMLDVDVEPGISVNSLEFTSQPMGYGHDFANWSNHVTKMVSHYDWTENWSTDASLNIYWGYPGAQDWANFRHSRSSAFYTPGYSRPFDLSAYLNLGVQYTWNKRTNIQLMGYNLLGLFDMYLNKRRHAFPKYWAGAVRMHAPSASLRFTHRF